MYDIVPAIIFPYFRFKFWGAFNLNIIKFAVFSRSALSLLIFARWRMSPCMCLGSRYCHRWISFWISFGWLRILSSLCMNIGSTDNSLADIARVVLHLFLRAGMWKPVTTCSSASCNIEQQWYTWSFFVTRFLTSLQWEYELMPKVTRETCVVWYWRLVLCLSSTPCTWALPDFSSLSLCQSAVSGKHSLRNFFGRVWP